MHNKWLQQLPDKLPPLEDVSDEERKTIEELHALLVQKDNQNARRLKELFDKHGISFRITNDVGLRLNLLIEMFVGHLSEERLRFEIQWMKVNENAIEESYAEFLDQQREQRNSKEIYLPGRGLHVVKPTDGGSREEGPEAAE